MFGQPSSLLLLLLGSAASRRPLTCKRSWYCWLCKHIHPHWIYCKGFSMPDKPNIVHHVCESKDKQNPFTHIGTGLRIGFGTSAARTTPSTRQLQQTSCQHQNLLPCVCTEQWAAPRLRAVCANTLPVAPMHHSTLIRTTPNSSGRLTSTDGSARISTSNMT